MIPASLPPAISEPEKVIPPISRSSTVVSVVLTGWADRGRDPRWEMASLNAMSAAAPPPTALNRLTSWGMAVIFTRRAMTRPAAAPATSPTASAAVPTPVMTWSRPSTTTVVSTARIMPAAESRFPPRADIGDVILCRPRMKQTAAAR
jgi:hypothetical protein